MVGFFLCKIDLGAMMNILEEELAEEGISSGIEKEEDYTSEDPFNPDSISIASKVIALDTVLRRIRNGTIRLAPDFQRKYVWDKKRKGLLIESMMLKIPLPMFYVSEDRDGIWEVVDGLQRLTTIKDYILGPDGDGKGFKLSGLEFWGNIFDGKTFFQISNDNSLARIVNNIMESELSFTIISPETPETVKRNIFKRINTGGMRLSNQEIRHALYQGDATQWLQELVESTEYTEVIGDTVKDNRMGGRELILRALAFVVIGPEKFKGDMDDFLSSAMRLINRESLTSKDAYYGMEFPDKGECFNNISTGLRRSFAVFGDFAFRKSLPNEKKTPINKSLFDVWIFFFSLMGEREFSDLMASKCLFMERYRNLLHEPEFDNSISRHGSNVYGVDYRYRRIAELLDGMSEYD